MRPSEWMGDLSQWHLSVFLPSGRVVSLCVWASPLHHPPTLSAPRASLTMGPSFLMYLATSFQVLEG